MYYIILCNNILLKLFSCRERNEMLITYYNNNSYCIFSVLDTFYCVYFIQLARILLYTILLYNYVYSFRISFRDRMNITVLKLLFVDFKSIKNHKGNIKHSSLPERHVIRRELKFVFSSGRQRSNMTSGKLEIYFISLPDHF